MAAMRAARFLAACLLFACNTPSESPDASLADAPPVDAAPTIDTLGPPPPAVDATVNGFRVHLDRASATLSIARPDGTMLLNGLPGGDASGDPHASPSVGIAVRHGTANYQMMLGQFRITDTSTAPWIGVARYGEPTGTDPLSVPLIAGNGTTVGTLEIGSSGAHGLRLHTHTSDTATDRVSFAFDCAAAEHFLGFGGQSFDVDHRGQTIPLWVEEDGIGKNTTDTDFSGFGIRGRRHSTHSPMPMFVSSRGYAVLLDTPYRSIFAMCSEDPSAVRVESWEDDLDLYVLDAPTPGDGVERLTEIVGRPTRPPNTMLAPWLDAIFGSAHVREVAARARTNDVPVSAIWTEDFRGGSSSGSLGYALEEDWNIDPVLYADFPALATELHDDGFAFLTYNNSFLAQGADVYTEATTGGFSIHNRAGAPYTFASGALVSTSLVDFSNPAATTWAEGVMQRQLDAGANGWMADFAEWLPTDAVLHSGEDALAQHNLYPLAWQRANRDLLDALDPSTEPVWFVRSAYLRSQALVQVFWAGDQTTDWELGDGLPSVIPMGIGLGMTGFPYFGSDIGGYISIGTVPTTRELFFRWASFGALTPVMRTHHGRQAMENWQWDHDAETTAHFARWARVHQQLFPYLRALADEASMTGRPMMRPLAYDHPTFEPGWSITDEYTLGPIVFVAPVQEEGATSRMVTLPPGTYRPLLGGTPVTSTGAAFSVAADVTECPAFVPEGAMIVALPPSVDTVRTVGTSSTSVTLASVHDDREIWLYGPGTSDFGEGTMTYAWRATGWSGAAASATWNGTPVTITGRRLSVVGTGTLVLDGSAMLTITGGASDRAITVVLR